MISARIFTTPLVAALLSLPAGANEWPGLRPGSHPVGFKTVETVDRTRSIQSPTNYFGEAHSDYGERPIQIAIWYPAQSQSDGARMTYADYVRLLAWDAGWREDGGAERQAAVLLYIQTVTPLASPPIDATIEKLFAKRTWAHRDAAPAHGSFPVLVYAPGGDYPAFDNSVLCEYLASHGYIVVASPSVGPDARKMSYDAFGLEAQARDLEFLAGFLHTLPGADRERIATAGFSSGALASAIFAMRHARVKVMINLDSPVRHAGWLAQAQAILHFDPERLRIPILFFTCAPDRAIPGFDDASFLDAAHYADITMVEIAGIDHHDLASMSSILRRGAEPRRDEDWTQANQGYEALCRITRFFLDQALKGDSAAGRSVKDAAESVGRITLRRAKKAPPGPEDFNAILSSRGPSGAAALMTALATEHPETLPAFEAIANQAGYDWLMSGRTRGAIAIFELNAQHFPESINVLDSLGEAYLAAEEWTDAEACYREVLRKLAQAGDLPEETRAAYAANAERGLATIEQRR